MDKSVTVLFCTAALSLIASFTAQGSGLSRLVRPGCLSTTVELVVSKRKVPSLPDRLSHSQYMDCLEPTFGMSLGLIVERQDVQQLLQRGRTD